jgi:hypothetical protein
LTPAMGSLAALAAVALTRLPAGPAFAPTGLPMTVDTCADAGASPKELNCQVAAPPITMIAGAISPIRLFAGCAVHGALCLPVFLNFLVLR